MDTNLLRSPSIGDFGELGYLRMVRQGHLNAHQRRKKGLSNWDSSVRVLLTWGFVECLRILSNFHLIARLPSIL